MRAQLEYRASFALSTFSTGLTQAGEFLALGALFARFHAIGGFGFAEICVFYGLVNAGLAIADTFSRGLDNLGALVKSGEFDRVLLRPHHPIALLLCQELTLRRLTRVAIALGALVYGLDHSAGTFGAAKLALCVAAIAGCAMIFLGLWVIEAAFAFYSVESVEFMNVFTYGGADVNQYPLSIFQPWLRRVFVAFVPVACTTYYPALALLGRPDPLGAPPLLGWIAWLAGPLFLCAAILIFQRALRSYTSTGS